MKSAADTADLARRLYDQLGPDSSDGWLYYALRVTCDEDEELLEIVEGWLGPVSRGSTRAEDQDLIVSRLGWPARPSRRPRIHARWVGAAAMDGEVGDLGQHLQWICAALALMGLALAAWRLKARNQRAKPAMPSTVVAGLPVFRRYGILMTLEVGEWSRLREHGRDAASLAEDAMQSTHHWICQPGSQIDETVGSVELEPSTDQTASSALALIRIDFDSAEEVARIGMLGALRSRLRTAQALQIRELGILASSGNFAELGFKKV